MPSVVLFVLSVVLFVLSVWERLIELEGTAAPERETGEEADWEDRGR